MKKLLKGSITSLLILILVLDACNKKDSRPADRERLAISQTNFKAAVLASAIVIAKMIGAPQITRLGYAFVSHSL